MLRMRSVKSSREWVRRKDARWGRWSGEPEKVEHGQSVQRSMTQQWVGPIDKSKRSVAVDEEVMARQDADAPDDFFEDDTDNEDSEVGESLQYALLRNTHETKTGQGCKSP